MLQHGTMRAFACPFLLFLLLTLTVLPGHTEESFLSRILLDFKQKAEPQAEHLNSFATYIAAFGIER